MTFPSPDDFPDFDNIDSRSVIDDMDSFSELAADYETELEPAELAEE